MKPELNKAPAADELLARLQPQVPPGLRIELLEALSPGSQKARTVSASCQTVIPVSRLPELEAPIQRLFSASTSLVRRRDRSAPIDLSASPFAPALREDILEMRLKTDPGGGAGPRNVLAALGLGILDREEITLSRTDVEIAS